VPSSLPPATRLPLPKDCLLTKPWQYQKVYRQGQRAWGKGITLIFVDNDQGQDRLGISISGQKLAVRRNRIKRLLKEFYRHHRNLPSQVANHSDSACGVDMVIATNQKFQPRCLAEIQKILARLTEGPGGCDTTKSAPTIVN
jgi:ribonuclease P protein component